MYNKHSVGNFGPFVSIADRAEALPEHAKRVSWVRSSDTRRRKPTNKGFSPKCASVMRAGGFRTFHDYIAIMRENKRELNIWCMNLLRKLFFTFFRRLDQICQCDPVKEIIDHGV